MSDGHLVRRTMAGDNTAYEELVYRWSARLTAYLRARVHRVDVAEDLAQEVLLRAYRNLATLNSPDKFGAWLLSIAHASAIDWLKAKARSEVSFDELNQQCGVQTQGWTTGEPPPDQQCISAERRDILLESVHSLPQPLREVLLIYYYDDATYQEIADMLGVSTATVNARLTKARAMLRGTLAATGETQ